MNTWVVHKCKKGENGGKFIFYSSSACCCRSIGSLLYQLLMQLDTEAWKCGICSKFKHCDSERNRESLKLIVSTAKVNKGGGVGGSKSVYWTDIDPINTDCVFYLCQILGFWFQLTYRLEFKVIEKENLRTESIYFWNHLKSCENRQGLFPTCLVWKYGSRPKIVILASKVEDEVNESKKLPSQAETQPLPPDALLPDVLHIQVFFLTGPTQKSSKYGTGPPQYRKMTKFTGDGKNPLLKKWKSMSQSVRPSLFAVS